MTHQPLNDVPQVGATTIEIASLRAARDTATCAAPLGGLDRRALWLFLPLLGAASVIRLLEYSLLRRGEMQEVGVLLWCNLPMPALIVLFGFAVYWTVRSSWPTGHTVLASAAATATSVVLTAIAYQWAPWWLTEWTSLAAIEAVRHDLLLLVSCMLLFALVRTVPWRWIRSLSAIVGHVAVPFLMLVAILQFGYLLSTGAPSDWSFIKYVAGNWNELGQLVVSEFSPLKMLLLSIPAALSLGAALVTTLRSRPEPTRDRTVRTHDMIGLFAPVIIVLLALPRPSLTYHYAPASFVGLAESIASDLGPDRVDLSLVTSERPFDTKSLALAGGTAPASRNIVVVLLESARDRSTTPYNPDLNTTPFLDSLATAGMLVENMYAVVSYTNKALIPALAGIYPRPVRTLDEAVPGGIPGRGLPALLEPHGYRTAFFTPATLDFERKDRILANLGFDHAFGDGDFPTEGFDRKAYFGFEDAIGLAPAMEWVDTSVEMNQPFFLTYLTLTSHHPYDVPDDFPFAEPGDESDDLARYHSSLRYTDEFVRRFIDEFRQRMLLESTTFIILGDHGEAFGEHLQKLHGDVVWEEGVRVPAVLYGSGIEPGTRAQGLRQQIDILPTVADLLGLELTGGTYPGESLLRPAPAERSIYLHTLDGARALALRRGNLKFHYFFKRKPTRVYDLSRDPYERHNVASSMPLETIESAELELLLWRRSVETVYRDHFEREQLEEGSVEPGIAAHQRRTGQTL